MMTKYKWSCMYRCSCAVTKEKIVMNQPIVMSHCQNRHILYHESYVVQRVIVLFVQGNEILQENAGLKRDKAALMAELAAMRTKVATLETKVRFRIPVKYDFHTSCSCT